MKFRKKPVVIEAIQWFPGAVVDGVRVRERSVHYSADRTLYYVTHGKLRSNNWLSVETVPGSPPKDQHGAWHGFAQFNSAQSGAYHRKVLSFHWFEVKSGDVEPVSESNDLFLDYAALEGWGKEAFTAPQEGWIETLEGNMTVSPGDWVITGVKGERYPCKPDIFDATYEAV